ncbi:MAG: hypothetical protein ABWX90_03585 [Candidatus Saccharimonadales bacterium]
MNAAVPFFHTVRVTSATRQRAENMLQVLNLFKTHRVLDALDVQNSLCYSPSGARKYLADLVRNGIVIIRTKAHKHLGLAEYHLSDNEQRIQEFEISLKNYVSSDSKKSALPYEDRPASSKQRTLTIHEKYPDRQIYVVGDDMNFATRLTPNKGEGKRDPLVAALFGPPKRIMNSAV